MVAAQRQLLVQLSAHMLRNFPQLPPPERIVLLGAESQHRHRVGAMLLTSPPLNLSDLLRAFYAGRLSQFSAALEEEGGGGEAAEEGSSGEDAVMGEGSPSKSVAASLGEGWGGAVEGVAAAMRTFGLEVRAPGRGTPSSRVLSPSPGLGLESHAMTPARSCASNHPRAAAAHNLPTQAVSEEAYAAVLCDHLRGHLSEQSQAAFDCRTLEAALAYSRTAPLHFLRLVLPPGVSGARGP